MVEVAVHVEVEVNPTEDEAKVKSAINQFLGNTTFSSNKTFKGITLTADAKGLGSLLKFRTILRSDKIRDAARKLLFHAMNANRISFCLNKQVAFAGHVSFCEETAESPLGSIRVIIESDDPLQVIEWLAEKSSKQ
jgi:uncharacterized protein